MMKRNLGDSLRARSARARMHEQLLRVITHNLMIFRRHERGSRQSRHVRVSFPGSTPKLTARIESMRAGDLPDAAGVGRIKPQKDRRSQRKEDSQRVSRAVS